MLAAAGAVAILLLSGCQKDEPANNSASPVEAGTFTGQKLPEKVENLTGTPFYTTSKELTPQAKVEGACYLVIAPQSPTKAVLVVEKMSKPEEVAARPSELTEFSGQTTSIDSPDLIKLVKESYDLDLNLTDDGKIAVLELSRVPTKGATPATAEVEKGE